MRFKLTAKWNMTTDDHMEQVVHTVEYEEASKACEQVYAWLIDTSKHGSLPKVEIEPIIEEKVSA